MKIEYISENSFSAISQETDEASIGKTIEFPNHDGELLLSVHGTSDTLNPQILDQMEQFAGSIAQDYESFLQMVAQFIVDNVDSDTSLDLDQLLQSLDLVQITSDCESPVFVLAMTLDSCLDEGQYMNVYYDLESDELADIELIDTSDEETPDELEDD
jgi:hypothetical protein